MLRIEARAVALLATALCAALLCGCASFAGMKPQARLADAASLAFRPAASPLFPSGDWPRADWWTVFGDDGLNALIASALRANPDVRQAEARWRAAQSLAGVAAAADRPSCSKPTCSPPRTTSGSQVGCSSR